LPTRSTPFAFAFPISEAKAAGRGARLQESRGQNTDGCFLYVINQALTWMEERKAELLSVPYFHVMFTLPVRIGAIAYQNKSSTISCSKLPRRQC
jgi:hypothetical protein